MLGIADGAVALAYWLCIGSTVLCVIYGLITWNMGQEEARDEDVRWAKEEEKVEEEL